jgi:hypothetical protein
MRPAAVSSNAQSIGRTSPTGPGEDTRAAVVLPRKGVQPMQGLLREFSIGDDVVLKTGNAIAQFEVFETHMRDLEFVARIA